MMYMSFTENVYAFLSGKCPLCGSRDIEREKYYNVAVITIEGAPTTGWKLIKLKCKSCRYELHIVMPDWMKP